SVKVTGTVSVRCSPCRPKIRCGLTCTVTYRSPDGPPRSPTAPLPLSLIRCPSWTPAGIRTCIVLLDWPRPEPWQVSHGWSTTRPRPMHSVHGSVIANTPPCTEVCIPVPSHLRPTFGTVPYFAPVPWQVLHGSSLVIRRPTVTPLTASANSIVASDSMSWPRRGRCVVVVRGPPPKTPPRMSPSPPPPAAPPRLNRSPTSKLKP